MERHIGRSVEDAQYAKGADGMSEKTSYTVRKSGVVSSIQRHSRKASSIATFIGSVVLGIIVWQLISMLYTPYFFPSPVETWVSFKELTEDGVLAESITASAG